MGSATEKEKEEGDKEYTHWSTADVSGETATGVGGVRTDARPTRTERPNAPLPVLPGTLADADTGATRSSPPVCGCGCGASASAFTMLFLCR